MNKPLGRALVRAPRIPALLVAGGTRPRMPEGSEPGLEPWRDGRGNVFAYSRCEGENHWVFFPGIAEFRFREDAGPVRATPVFSAPASSVEEAYYRSLMPIVIQARGSEVLHASAIVTSKGVAGFCGESGAGKSTLAYALGARGYRIWADDALEFQAEKTSAQTRPLPFQVRLRPKTLRALGSASTRPLVLDAADRQSPLPLSWLFVLKRVEGSAIARPSTLKRLRSARALTGVLQHAYCSSLARPERKRQMVRQYLGLCATTAIFELAFRPGWGRLDAVLGGIQSCLEKP